ncbi:hypothetical protein KI387_021481, partial [Taxus chinensis]
MEEETEESTWWMKMRASDFSKERYGASLNLREIVTKRFNGVKVQFLSLLYFSGIHDFSDAQMNGLSTESLAFRILQMMAYEESILPNTWVLGGTLMALMATVTRTITVARMIRLRLQEKRADINNELGKDAQMNSLSAEPLAFRILQMMGYEESILPNTWVLGGILMALL